MLLLSGNFIPVIATITQQTEFLFSNAGHFMEYVVFGIVIEIAQPEITVTVRHDKARDGPSEAAQMSAHDVFIIFLLMFSLYRLCLPTDVLDFFICNLVDLADYVFHHSFSIFGEFDRIILQHLHALVRVFGLLEILRVCLPELLLLLVESIALLLNHCIEGMVNFFGEFLAVACVEVMLLHNRGDNLLTELLFGLFRQEVGIRGHIHV